MGINITWISWHHGGGLAYGVSDDGTIAVGYGRDADDESEAFRWTEETGMVGLGSLGDAVGKNLGSRAYEISGDGSVIVGWSENPEEKQPRNNYGLEAFRWTEDPEWLVWATCPVVVLAASRGAVSGDGSVIGGIARPTPEARLLSGTKLNGMRSLQDVLTNEYGLDLTGWQLTESRTSRTMVSLLWGKPQSTRF